MDVRVLRYFLAVAREQSISEAAEYLHLTQPTLSRQMIDLEKELGKPLFIRGKKGRHLALTEAGILLRKRAEEIVELVGRAEKEISLSDGYIAGDVYIGAAESYTMKYLMRVAQTVQASHPDIRFHIVSGDGEAIRDWIDKGLLDFGLLVGPQDSNQYEGITLPARDGWELLMRKDAPLAEKEYITAEDLADKPLLIPRQAVSNSEFPLRRWMRQDPSRLNVVATYTLIYNGSVMVQEGMGYAFVMHQLINTSGESCFCVRPLSPPVTVEIHVIWKRYQIFSKAARLFIERLKEELNRQGDSPLE